MYLEFVPWYRYHITLKFGLPIYCVLKKENKMYENTQNDDVCVYTNLQFQKQIYWRMDSILII